MLYMVYAFEWKTFIKQKEHNQNLYKPFHIKAYTMHKILIPLKLTNLEIAHQKVLNTEHPEALN